MASSSLDLALVDAPGIAEKVLTHDGLKTIWISRSINALNPYSSRKQFVFFHFLALSSIFPGEVDFPYVSVSSGQDLVLANRYLP
ncbi:hypothetical protein V6N13_087013 [Hibiscus sabdariffa]|uniref:Uncharacterized protein n=1 Tax=Hibiscus sabdariffa TaxID=183260 RepID=A0ABR2FUY2_9ROSI